MIDNPISIQELLALLGEKDVAIYRLQNNIQQLRVELDKLKADLDLAVRARTE